MAKSFKRTLIAAFGLLFLFATAFVAASCAEEAAVESYKVTLDYDDTHGSVTLSPEAENNTYVSGTSVTVTVTPSGDYTVGTFKVNGEDKTLTNENTFTFDVVQDTTVAVTFNPPVPTPPTLDISEKWVGTYTGNNVMADPEAVWVISITDTAVSLTIDGDAQTITDVEFAPDDDSFTFTLDGETVTVDAYGQEDGYGVYTLSVGTETYSVVASLTDASKVPPEPPLGDTITAFPQDFRGTWYGTESYDGVLYTIVVNDTTMTITAGDGSPTTINVADVLYDAQDGEDDFGYPTLYFTYNDTEESTLELGYDGEYLVFESGDIYVSTLTHDMPEPEYGNPTNFLLEIEGTYVNGRTRFAVYNASVTTFVVLNDPVDFTVLGLDPDSATDVLVIEDNYDGTLYRIEKDGGDLTLTGGYLDGITLTKQEEVHVLPSAFYGKWYRPGDTDYFYDVSDTGTVQWNAYFADPKDVDVVGIDGVYTLDGSTATLTDNNTILVVAGDDRINYYYKEGLTPTLPDGLANTEWTGVQIATVSFNNNNVSIGPSTYYVYHVNDDGSFNAYANASMHRFTYSGGVLTCDDEQLTREGGEVPSDGIPADFDGTYKTPDGTHTIVIADGSMTYDATPATGVEPYGDGSYDVTIGEDGYVLTLTDFGTVKICSWSGDDGTQSFFVPDGTVSGKINAALVGTWKGTADAWYDDNGPSEDAAIFGDMTFVVADDGSATLNGEDTFVFVTAEDDGEYSYWFIGMNEAFGSCTYLISYIPAEDPDTIALTLLGAYYNDLAKEEAGPTYDDPTAFLAQIEGAWYNSSPLGETSLVVSGGKVTEFKLRGDDYTSSTYVLGLDDSGRLVIEAGDTLYYFTYSSQYTTLNITDENGWYDFDLDKLEVTNTLPSEYVGKWVKINGEGGAPYIVVARDGTAKYYSYDGASGTDLKIVGSGNSYSFDYMMFDDGTLTLRENNRVLSVGNLNFAKDGVEVPDEEKIPAALRSTTWSCADPSFSISSFTFDADGLTADTGDVVYHVYLVSYSSDVYSFNAYSGGDVHSFDYYTTDRIRILVDDEYTFREGGSGGEEDGLAAFAGTYTEFNGTRTVVIGDDGSVTIDGTPADSVEPYGDGTYDVIVGEDEYTLTPIVGACTLLGLDGMVVFVSDSAEESTVNSQLVGTWNGTADGWYADDDMGDLSMLGDITLVVNPDGSVTLNDADAFVFIESYDEDLGQYTYWLVGSNEAYGTCLYTIVFESDSEAMTISLFVDPFTSYYLDLVKGEEGPTYEDATAFLAQIEGSWNNSSVVGDTNLVVSDGEVTKFELRGTDYTDSMKVLGLDESGRLVIEADGALYYFTYSSQYGTLNITDDDFYNFDLDKLEVKNTLPSDYVGKWVAINGEAYIVVSDDGTAKYYTNAEDAGTDLTVVGSGNSYSFSGATFDGGTLALKEDGRVLSVGNLNFAKDGVDVAEEERLPEELRGTTWDCASPSFDISSFTFDADGLTADTGDTVYHVYFTHFDSASSSYTFKAYSGDDVHSFEYTHGALYVDGDYTFLKGEGGGADDLAAFAGTYQEANGTRTVVIGDNGSVTIDDTPADSVKPDGEGAFTVTVGDSEYTLTPTDYEVIKIFTLMVDETQACFVPQGTVEATINSLLVGTWKGTADAWTDDFGPSLLGPSIGDVTLVVNPDGSATLNDEDTFVFFGMDYVDEERGYTQYSYYLVGTSVLGSFIYEIDYIPGEHLNIISVTVTVVGDRLYLDLEKDSSTVPDAKIDESLYGTWRGTSFDTSYVVKIDADGVHFTSTTTGHERTGEGDVHDVAAGGLSFYVDVKFSGTDYFFNYHAVYSDADSTLTLTEGSLSVILTKDSDDMETIPTVYQGKWVLADYKDETKIVGDIEVTKNTIKLTYKGKSYSTVKVTLDDVDGRTVTFTADGDEYKLSTDAYSGTGAWLCVYNSQGWWENVATFKEEGYSGTFEIPESVKGDYHTEDNNVTVKVGDTITGTIDGKEVTFNVTGMTSEMGAVTIYLATDDGGKGYIMFYDGDGDTQDSEYTFSWAADGNNATDYDLIKEGGVDPTAHPLMGTWNTASSDSAFAGKDIVVDHDGGVTVGGDEATLTEDGSSWKLTFGGKDYTITNTTYGSDVLVINDPDGGVHFAFRDGVTHSVDLNVEALVGTWENTDKGITIVVTPDGITLNGETAFAYAYHNGTQGYKILAGGVQYNFYTVGEGTADLFNNKAFETTHLTLVPDPEEPIEGLADWVGTYKTVGGAHTVVVTEGSIKLDGIAFTGLTKQDADFSGTLDGDSYLISRAADGNWLSVKKTSDNSVVYYVKDGADGVAVPSALDGTYTDGDSTHTVVIAGGTLTLDSTQTFVYEASETEVKFFVEGGSGSFTVAEGVYTLTLTGTADAGATTLTKSDVKEEPIEGLADFVGTYKTLDKAHTVVVTETGITVSGTALTEITAGDGDGVFTAKKGTTDCTVRLYDRYVNIGSDYYVKDGEVSLTVDSKFDGTFTGTGISSHSEYTFVIKDGKITLNDEEAFVLTSSNGSFRLLFVDGRSGSLVSYDNGASFTYTSGSDEVRLVKVIEGGGADGVVSFDKKISRKDMIGTFTGTDKQERNWTVTTTETSIKIEINGVVQTLTKVSSYGDNGIDFTIDGIGECSFMWWSMDNACVVQFHSDWTTCTLTKA